MTGEELRERIKRLGLSYRAAAPRLGLSLSGLHHNLRNETSISRQTEIILYMLERESEDLGSRSLIRPGSRRRDAVEASAQQFKLNEVARCKPALKRAKTDRR